MNKYLIISLVGGLLLGCQSGQQQKQEVTQQQQEEPVVKEEVKEAPIIEVQAQGIMLGKVVATRYADLSFQTSLPILRMLVKNGQQVRQGQRIAELDMFKKRKAQYMATDKEGRDVFMADSAYVLSMAQQDYKHIKFHFTSEF